MHNSWREKRLHSFNCICFVFLLSVILISGFRHLQLTLNSSYNFFHIISLGKHLPVIFFNFLQWMIWVCNDVKAMLCETLINIKIYWFELSFPASNYLFKISNRNRRKCYEICLKLRMKKPERFQWRRFGIFIVNLEHISLLFLVFAFDFEQLVACWCWTNNMQL